MARSAHGCHHVADRLRPTADQSTAQPLKKRASQRLRDAPLAAPWVTMKSTFPPDHTTVIAPMRAPSASAATEYGIVAPLRPDVGPVRVIHGVVVEALNEQPFWVLRVATKLKLPPAFDTVCEDGESV